MKTILFISFSIITLKRAKNFYYIKKIGIFNPLANTRVPLNILLNIKLYPYKSFRNAQLRLPLGFTTRTIKFFVCAISVIKLAGAE